MPVKQKDVMFDRCLGERWSQLLEIERGFQSSGKRLMLSPSLKKGRYYCGTNVLLIT